MSSSRRDKGEAIRRQVMGSEFVDRALDNSNEFDAPLQDMVMDIAWGTVWENEDVISHKTRSLLTISMLIALRATGELKGHIRGALRNGCSTQEIREAIMHSAIYCGCPAALAAARAAREVIDQI